MIRQGIAHYRVVSLVSASSLSFHALAQPVDLLKFPVPAAPNESGFAPTAVNLTVVSDACTDELNEIGGR